MTDYASSTTRVMLGREFAGGWGVPTLQWISRPRPSNSMQSSGPADSKSPEANSFAQQPQSHGKADETIPASASQCGGVHRELGDISIEKDVIQGIEIGMLFACLMRHTQGLSRGPLANMFMLLFPERMRRILLSDGVSLRTLTEYSNDRKARTTIALEVAPGATFKRSKDAWISPFFQVPIRIKAAATASRDLEDVFLALVQHSQGNWGNCPLKYVRANYRAVAAQVKDPRADSLGFRGLYSDRNGNPIAIGTALNRSWTEVTTDIQEVFPKWSPTK
ncbi:MAG: hypothetical protein NT154_14945 [Verrucomicrobia bacterium]|nr:hypothetical protein [Verrucomicrobiota bacterium]